MQKRDLPSRGTENGCSPQKGHVLYKRDLHTHKRDLYIHKRNLNVHKRDIYLHKRSVYTHRRSLPAVGSEMIHTKETKATYIHTKENYYHMYPTDENKYKRNHMVN